MWWARYLWSFQKIWALVTKCIYLYRMINTATSFYKLALIVIVLSILTKNCEGGSFYPTFTKIRPSLTRFKNILSRNRFRNIPKFRPHHQDQISYGRPPPQKSTYWRYTRVQNGKIKPNYIFWRFVAYFFYFYCPTEIKILKLMN